MKPKKIFVIASARPNLMKVAPLMRALAKHPGAFHPQVICTGRRYDADMSDILFHDRDLQMPDCFVAVGSGSQTRAVEFYDRIKSCDCSKRS